MTNTRREVIFGLGPMLNGPFPRLSNKRVKGDACLAYGDGALVLGGRDD